MPNPDVQMQAMLGMMLGPEGIEVGQRMESTRVTQDAQTGEKWYLPREMQGSTRAEFLTLGFVFPEETEDDKSDTVLAPVVAPRGWRLSRTDGYWSDILDERGRKRGLFGYKGAFYDRWSQSYLLTRYKLSREYSHHLDKKDMPPEIAALQVEQRFEKPRPERKPRQDVYKRKGWWRVDQNGFRVFEEEGYPVYERWEPEPPVEYEMKVVNTFEPFKNPDHKKLPYLRYYVEDTVTGKRMWVGKWLTAQQVTKLDWRGEKHPNWTGETWLNKHFPNHADVTAYW